MPSEAGAPRPHPLWVPSRVLATPAAKAARLLGEMGCPYGQGYLFSKPVSAEEITTLLASPLLVKENA